MGAMEAVGRRVSFFVVLFFLIFPLSRIIWRRNIVVFWGYLRRPPPDGAPRHPPLRP